MFDPALVERFDNPPTEYGPTPLWWWSGGTVTEEGIAWQLRRFVDGGIRNLVLMNLAPKGPTYGAPPDDPVWFGERWWDLFRFTCDQAAGLGINLWFYDQIGFSGANLQGLITARHPEAAGRSLRSRIVVVGEDGSIPLEAREHVIGLYDEHEDETESGWRRHDLQGAGVTELPAGSQLRLVTWRETAFDYLDAGSVARLIDFVHGEYERRVPEHVGSTIVGSFQDELPAMPTWSATFADRFLAETGYDLVPCLPALWDHESENSARIRADYHLVRTRMAEEAFFRPLGEWHDSRGMLIGADQMNPGRAGVPTQSIQLYGDYFATHRWFSAVGSDHEGDARIHSSMADLYDHPRVWIESFHSSGWGGTLEETWDWLIPFFRSGANLYNPHASYYGLRAGWFEWAPPSTDFRQPYYELYPKFARAVARVSAMMTWGRHAVDVALLYPTASIRSELPPDLPIDHFSAGDIGPEYPGVDDAQRAYMALAGKNDWFRSSPGLLDRAGIDFDVIDDDSLARAETQDGAAHVNGFGFRVVILPNVTRISGVVAERLANLLDVGGRVIAVGAAPSSVAGSGGGSADTPSPDGIDAPARRLAGHPRLETVGTAEEAVRALDGLTRFASAPHGVRAQRDGDLAVALVPGAFPNATAYPLRTGTGAGDWDDIDFDAARYSERSELRVAGTVAEAEIWNPATGTRTSARFTVDGDESTIAVDAGGAPLLLAVWRTTDASDAGETPAPRGTSDSALGASPIACAVDWVQELVPTLDNRWGDFALPAGTDGIPLEIWQVDLVAGTERTPVRVTFGQEVLVTEPFGPDDAPEPIDRDRAARVRDGESLGDARWGVQRYSASQGRDGALGAPQDPKGFIGEEFVTHTTPASGEEVALRALIRVEEPGEYELTISSACPTRVWFDGGELAIAPGGYDATVLVHFTGCVGVLEYRLGAPDLPARHGGRLPERMTASFTLDRPGQRVARPEFMAAGERGVEDGTARFRRRFRINADASSARVVTGAPTALTVLMDGRDVARQEKVEYYESGLGDNPMYFTHDIGRLTAGEHEIEVVTEGVAADTPLFVDLVLEVQEGRVSVPSGADWTVGPDDANAVLLPARTGGTPHARAARRPHPLAAAHWLSGPPEIGVPAVPFETSASAVPRSQTFEATLPAGTVAVELPVDPESVLIDGRPAVLSGRTATPAEPTSSPATMSVTVAERTFSTSGAAWAGPIVVRTAPTRARFEDWADQGLAAWSGAVRYSASITVARGESIRLDLGRVRGAVTVDVDGERVDSAFCAPFTFCLDGLAAAPHAVAVTVYGTLGPRYAAATQSTFFVPSQLRTGITGPVRVERVPAADGARR